MISSLLLSYSYNNINKTQYTDIHVRKKGIWLFHCHIEWHITSGLIATMVEAPLDLQNTLTIPQGHLDACTSQDIATVGNAAGNAIDFTNLKGENSPPDRLPEG